MATGLLIYRKSEGDRVLHILTEYDTETESDDDILIVSTEEQQVIEHAEKLMRENEYDSDIIFDETEEVKG